MKALAELVVELNCPREELVLWVRSEEHTSELQSH